MTRDHSARHSSLRHKLMLHTQTKLDIVRHTQGFKIISLPPKNDVMNICSMPVTAKTVPKEPTEPDEKPEKRKIFSVRKLNTFRETKKEDVRPWRSPSHH